MIEGAEHGLLHVPVSFDHAFPITGTSHADVRRYHVQDGQLLIDDLPLDQPEKFVGYKGDPRAPQEVVLKNNGLHVVLVFDRAHPIGSRDQALLADVQIESAISAIMDCEDPWPVSTQRIKSQPIVIGSALCSAPLRRHLPEMALDIHANFASTALFMPQAEPPLH